jgi:hypothetical protein
MPLPWISVPGRGLALVVLLAGCGDPPPARLVVRAGRLVDGSGGPVRERQRLLVDQGSIVEIRDDDGPLEDGPGVRILDARDATVLPGLVDTRIRLTGAGCEPGTRRGLSEAVADLDLLLRRGVTTAVDVGSPAKTAVALRRWTGTGRGRGPRLLVTGPALSLPGPASDDPEEAVRAAVRALADADLDLLALSPAPAADEAPALACTAVQEAHTQKLKVVVEAADAAGLAFALRCGAEAVAGAPRVLPADGDAARLAASRLLVIATPGRPPPPAGARVVLSTGTGCAGPGASPREAVEALVAAGATPAAALVAATHEAARVVGLEDALGLLAPGYRADLLVVDGRPDEQPADLERIRAVVLDGLEQPLTPPGLLRSLARVAGAGLELAWAWLQG